MSPTTIRLFHVDDDLFELQRVREHLTEDNLVCRFEVSSFETAEDLLDAVREKGPPDLALIDIHLRGSTDADGIPLTQALRKTLPNTVSIAYSSDFRAIHRSIAEGADDFILKSADFGDFRLRLYSIHKANQSRVRTASETFDVAQVALTAIGSSMQMVSKRLAKIRTSAIRAIHIQGESGTGKEVVADMLHSLLPNKTPFLKVNCAAISPHLLESELFGHAKGAFTGATADKVGYLESATGGWIFLDEIACLSLPAQAALLRAIENQQIARVGESKVRPIDLKIVSATNIPLETLVQQNLFRNDLLQRLREAEIRLLPLRERPEELRQMLDYFCKVEVGGPYTLSPEARKILESLEWKNGNVREVRNCIRAMTEHQIDKMLTAKGIPNWIWDQHSVQDKSTKSIAKQSQNTITFKYGGETLPSFETLTDLMLAELLRTLANEQGFQSMRKIAVALGLPRTTLNYRVKRLIDTGLVSNEEVARLSDGKKSAS